MLSYLLPLLQRALDAIGAPAGTEIPLGPPRQAGHGDLATSVALTLARTMGEAPRGIAEKIVANIDADPRYVASMEIAGAGFINFQFTPHFFQMRLADVLAAGNNYGRNTLGKDVRANVEYVSANPTGPLHTGHGRGAALGDTIANLLDWCGYDVTREYYFNNAGNQMRNLALSIHARYLQALGHAAELPENGYHGEYIEEIAREIILSHGNAFVEPTTETIETMRAFGEQWCFTRIRTTLAAFGIHHTLYFNEDTLYSNGGIERTLADLKARGATYEKDGAIWLKLEDAGLQDRVIIRSNGEPTYRLPDIAYHREKFARGFGLIVDLFGADHIATIADVQAALTILGYDTTNMAVVLNQMVSFVEDGEPVKMSKRSGKSLTLDSLIEELGADVVRFFFIMRSAGTQLEFDLNLAREHSEKNPVYYLQYAHARIAGVLRHAESEGITVPPNAPLDALTRPEELGLIAAILHFPERVAHAARELAPHILTEYLRELAVAFHKFYHECRVVAEAPPLRDARMRLLAATQTTLGNGLRILGVQANGGSRIKNSKL